VRWVVDTHWHPDHWMGNAEYADAFPGVRFVSAPATRDSIRSRGPGFVKGHQDSTAVYKGYEAMLARDVSPFRPDRAIASGERYALGLAVADGRAAFRGWQTARVVAPDVTVADSLAIHLGGRDVQVRFLGRANTAGDVVVWIPDASLLATGDLVVAPIPYAYGSYIGEWIDVLGRLHAFGARTLVPGHGPVQRDLAYVDRVRDALVVLRDRAADAARRGLTPDSARATTAFDDLERRFEGDDPTLRGLLWVHFIAPGFPRAYEEARTAGR
jgi:glyoxylase-like metal-dependent hydrolase (beta-lactamase superfamily II)